ncbi:unnamed protein product [Paramecium octaurelia]|uniref:Uncharacterized protein n=1 Tax=Paramecium octaurelia TaxID=43137 RepID=A0A8S1SXI9_PAROT|nr:unnamed protein product [Paramecium octaurelia]
MNENLIKKQLKALIYGYRKNLILQIEQVEQELFSIEIAKFKEFSIEIQQELLITMSNLIKYRLEENINTYLILELHEVDYNELIKKHGQESQDSVSQTDLAQLILNINK